ncbi:glycosyltransferase family 2 protein [Patescibacteria group bacterium]|nr:glycosyltransferase family 2 protein [Patescibacteria group bacterium]
MNKISKLSVVVPVYNEEKTIGKIIDKLYEVDFGKVKLEVITVNDGSKDNTLNVLKDLKRKYPIKIISYSKNKGKSCALRAGFKKVTGDVVTVQDGDLEYSPNDFVKMLKKMSEPGVTVVYGSRRLNKGNIQYSGLSFYAGGLLLTYMSNILYGGNITDEPTCYKMFESKLLKSVKLKSKRFEFCPEVTAKVLKKGVKIHEVPISYNPRKVSQGKKINMGDFLEAVWVLVKYRFVD